MEDADFDFVQDLPNNMIHQVAIKSLPQEWLWCETWCSDTEKSRAKTIDLVRPWTWSGLYSGQTVDLVRPLNWLDQ